MKAIMQGRAFGCFVAVVLVSIVALPSFGQNQFVKTLGGTTWDEGRSVIEVSDGGLVVTGNTGSYGAGFIDLLLVKFDASGNNVWTRTLGDTSYDYGYSVVEVSDGGLVVTGYTHSYSAAGEGNLLLAKFDGSGNHLGARTLGGTEFDCGYSVVEVSDGGLVVTGHTDSYSADDRDILLSKFDGSGDHLWTRILGGISGSDVGVSVVEVSDGGLVVTGTGGYVGAGRDLLLAKFHGSGNICTGEFVTPEVDTFYATVDSVDPTVTPREPDTATWIPIITDTTPVVTAVCESPSAFIDSIYPNPAEEGDTVTFSGHGTDTDGSIVSYYWSSSSAGSLSADSSFSTCGLLVVGTDTIYFRVQDDDSAWSEEASEILVIEVGVEDERSPSLPIEFSLSQNYPNPFNPVTEIRYALPVDCEVRLEVYNILGQKVRTLVDEKQQAGYKTARWDAGSPPSGIYFYRLQAGDFVQTRKMILLK